MISFTQDFDERVSAADALTAPADPAAFSQFFLRLRRIENHEEQSEGTRRSPASRDPSRIATPV